MDKLLGKIVDILFIFGLFGGVVILFVLGVLMILVGIEWLIGLDGFNMILCLIILLIIIVIFVISFYIGLKKGI